MRTVLLAFLLTSFAASAQFTVLKPVDLDKPGALAALEKEHPDHYRTVLQTVHATQQLNCVVDLKVYRAAVAGSGDPKKACRSHLIRTSYPAQVYLSIPVDRAVYTITTYLDRSQDVISPARHDRR
jgi:hypothetical protein